MQQHGYTQAQAEGFTEVLRDIDANEELTTKADLKDVELRLSNRLTAVVGLGVAFLTLVMGFLRFYD